MDRNGKHTETFARPAIAFDDQWSRLKSSTGYTGQVDLDLEGSSVACARFKYPAGHYSVDSSPHLGIGIVRSPFKLEYSSFGSSTSGAREVMASELVIAEPYAPYDASLKSSTKIDYVVVSQERLAAALPECNTRHTELPTGKDTFFQSPVLAPMVHALVSHLDAQQNFQDFYVEAMTDAIIAELFKMCAPNMAVSTGPRSVIGASDLAKIDAFINEMLHQPITADDVANMIGMRRSDFSKSFKDATGKTPYQYVIDRRVEKAKTMIGTTTQSLSQVAFNCGFSSQSHMTDTFKQRLGMTPAKLRKS